MLRYACLAVLGGCVDIGPIDLGENGFGFGDLGGFTLFTVPGTPGQQGNIAFAYVEGCPGAPVTPTCALSRGAILAGATTPLHLRGLAGGLPELTVASSAPEIFDVGPIDRARVQITAHTAGRATLVLTSSGAIYDQIDLVVGTPAALAFTGAAPVLLAGADASIPILATDASGTQLFGRGAIQLDPNGLVRATVYDLAADAQFAGSDHVVLSGALVGTTTITATLGALTATSLVTIADASDVARIVATQDVVDLADHRVIERFEAVTADGVEVRGAHCSPSVSAAFPVALTARPEGLVPNPRAPGDDVYLAAESAGAATVSCVFGNATASAQLAL